jgi:hypothetical protein
MRPEHGLLRFTQLLISNIPREEAEAAFGESAEIFVHLLFKFQNVCYSYFCWPDRGRE